MRRVLTILALFLFSAVFAQESMPVRVSVTSQPSGASVIIDGQDRGVTPLVMYDLKPGRHHLKFRLAGYREVDRYFRMDEAPLIEKHEVLEEIKGILLVKSEPEGCDIRIDGQSVGTTPRLITNLAAKNSYTVRLRKAGYLDQSFSVKFNGRVPVVKDVKLVLSSGRIDVRSEPVGAEVTVNGIVRGLTPLVVNDVPKGRATVKLSKEGFRDEIRELAINAGDKQVLSVALQGQPGTLHLTSQPEGARFYIDDEAHGKGPITIQDLKAGQYCVRAEYDGYAAMTKTVQIENGSSARVEFKLSNIMGRLEVRTNPVDAQVVLDGRIMGKTKSRDKNAVFSDVMAIENVSEGEHVLIVRKEGYAERVVHPKVNRESTTRCKIVLKRIFVPNVRVVTTRGTHEGVFVSSGVNGIVIEVKLGITRSFSKDEIRKIEYLSDVK